MLRRRGKKRAAAPKPPASTPKTEPVSAVVIPSHPFAPGTLVGFHLTSNVGVERGMAREPFENPYGEDVVQPNGTLAYSHLPKGQWCAVGKVGDEYRYHGFSVKAE